MRRSLPPERPLPAPGFNHHRLPTARRVRARPTPDQRAERRSTTGGRAAGNGRSRPMPGRDQLVAALAGEVLQNEPQEMQGPLDAAGRRRTARRTNAGTKGTAPGAARHPEGLVSLAPKGSGIVHGTMRQDERQPRCAATMRVGGQRSAAPRSRAGAQFAIATGWRRSTRGRARRRPCRRSMSSRRSMSGSSSVTSRSCSGPGRGEAGRPVGAGGDLVELDVEAAPGCRGCDAAYARGCWPCGCSRAANCDAEPVGQGGHVEPRESGRPRGCAGLDQPLEAWGARRMRRGSERSARDLDERGPWRERSPDDEKAVRAARGVDCLGVDVRLERCR